MTVLGRDGSVTQINRAALAMLEAESLGEVNGHSFFSRMAPTDRSALEALTGRVFAGQTARMDSWLTGLERVKALGRDARRAPAQ